MASAVAPCLTRAEAVDGYTKWEVEEIASGKSFVGCEWHEGTAPNRGWVVSLMDAGSSVSLLIPGEPDDTSLTHTAITLSRVRIHPAIDAALSPTSDNPVQNKAVKAAVDGKRGLTDMAVYAPAESWTILRDGIDVTAQVGQPSYHLVGQEPNYAYRWDVYDCVIDGDYLVGESDNYLDFPEDILEMALAAEADIDGPHEYILSRPSSAVVPTQDALARTSQLAGKADKSEMSVTPGTGAAADRTTIQLKSGTSATVLTSHQSLAGLAREYTFSAIETISSAGTELLPNEVTPVDAQNKRVSVEAENAYIAVALPAASANGRIRDFMLTLDCTALTDGEEPNVAWASGYVGANADADNLVADAAAVNVYYITEYAPNAFLVARQVIGGGS